MDALRIKNNVSSFFSKNITADNGNIKHSGQGIEGLSQEEVNHPSSKAGQRRLRTEVYVLPSRIQDKFEAANNQEFINVLLRYPVDPISSAVKANDKKSIEIMLKYGMKLNNQNDDYPPLWHALRLGLTDMAVFLIENGYVLDKPTGRFPNAIFLAICFAGRFPQHTQVIKKILERHINPNQRANRDVYHNIGNPESGLWYYDCANKTPVEFTLMHIQQRRDAKVPTAPYEEILKLLLDNGGGL